MWNKFKEIMVWISIGIIIISAISILIISIIYKTYGRGGPWMLACLLTDIISLEIAMKVSNHKTRDIFRIISVISLLIFIGLFGVMLFRAAMIAKPFIISIIISIIILAVIDII